MNKCRVVVPGRVNLIGEHIDYHNLPVLPMAIPSRITLDFKVTHNRLIEVTSATYGARQVALDEPLEASPAGDWSNYLKAALNAVRSRWNINHGFLGEITSSLPVAAGLSSSSALITAFTLALLRVNEISVLLNDLMAVLPEGEHFVGTRGGGMDHAAVLASRSGHASFIHFAPFTIEHVPVPSDWRFLVAHSLTRAEKSGAARERYNSCRNAGLGAMNKLRLSSYAEALSTKPGIPTTPLTKDEADAFLHVTTEAERVAAAVAAMRSADRQQFGRVLNASHASLRDSLRVSCPSLDHIVEIAQHAGADGARLTGAGFGGCAIILCSSATQNQIVAALERSFYSDHAEYNREEHLMSVTPSNGALYSNEN